MFTSLESIANSERVYKGSSATSEIVEQGKVILKMTSEKELTLNNVLFMPKIKKNLVSSFLLSRHGFHIVIEADMVTISKAKTYVEKGY